MREKHGFKAKSKRSSENNSHKMTEVSIVDGFASFHAQRQNKSSMTVVVLSSYVEHKI
jgi:hypothetical protein